MQRQQNISAVGGPDQLAQEALDLVGVPEGEGGEGVLGELGDEDPGALPPASEHLEGVLVRAVVADVHRQHVAAVGEPCKRKQIKLRIQEQDMAELTEQTPKTYPATPRGTPEPCPCPT